MFTVRRVSAAIGAALLSLGTLIVLAPDALAITAPEPGGPAQVAPPPPPPVPAQSGLPLWAWVTISAGTFAVAVAGSLIAIGVHRAHSSRAAASTT